MKIEIYITLNKFLLGIIKKLELRVSVFSDFKQKVFVILIYFL
jgi:hypothetical protein